MTKEEAIKYLEKRKEKALMLIEKSKADTPTNNKVREILTRKLEVLDMAISALKDGWIPIESIEDIPKSGEIWVTIQFDDREPDVEWFIWSEAFKQWVYEEDGYPITYHAMEAITAYMPHIEPEPYKGRK